MFFNGNNRILIRGCGIDGNRCRTQAVFIHSRPPSVVAPQVRAENILLFTRDGTVNQLMQRRVVDIVSHNDIVFFGDMVYSDSKITVPHKEAKSRLFVMIPLAEIAGKMLFPGETMTVSDILKRYEESAEYGNIIKTLFPLY